LLSAVLHGCTAGTVMQHLFSLIKVQKLHTGREQRPVIHITYMVYRCLNFDCGISLMAKV